MLTPYYQDDSVTLYNGDCREIVPQIGHFDAVMTDPPYALPTQVASGRSNTSNLGDLSISEHYFKGLLAELTSGMGDSGQMFLFCDGTFYPVLFCATYGKHSQALLVWDKGQIGMGREFRKSHELILRLWGKNTPTISDGTGHSDVLRFAPISPAVRVHPAEKPVALLMELMWCCGVTILDPFAGSGSVGEAAKKTGRKAVLVEIDEAYCEGIAKRMQQRDLALEFK